MYYLPLNLKKWCHFSFTTNDEIYKSIGNTHVLAPPCLVNV